MSETVIKVDPEIFTEEVTQKFLKEHEAACQTMDYNTFLQLFLKYDLTQLEDFNKIVSSVLNNMKNWKEKALNVELLEVTSFDSKCIFCNIGNKVKVYQWKSKYPLGENSECAILHTCTIGFRFEFKNNRLTEYGTCNSY